jgi:hypothetical protein
MKGPSFKQYFHNLKVPLRMSAFDRKITASLDFSKGAGDPRPGRRTTADLICPENALGAPPLLFEPAGRKLLMCC